MSSHQLNSDYKGPLRLTTYIYIYILGIKIVSCHLLLLMPRIDSIS